MTLEDARRLAALLSQEDNADTWCTCWCCMDSLAKRLSAAFPPHRFVVREAADDEEPENDFKFGRIVVQEGRDA